MASTQSISGMEVGPPHAAHPGGDALSRATRTPRRSHLRRLLVATDCVAVLCAQIAITFFSPTRIVSVAFLITTAAAVVAAVAVAHACGLYLYRVTSIRAIELSRLTWVSAASVTAMAVARQLSASAAERVSNVTLGSVAALVAAFVLTFLVLMLGRSTFDATLRERRRRGHNCRHVLVVGEVGERRQLVGLFTEHPELGYRVDGVLGRPEPSDANPVPWLGGESAVFEAIERTGASGVVFAASPGSPGERDSVVRTLVDRGVHVQISSGMGALDVCRLRRGAVGHQPIFYVERVRLRRPQILLKRVLDIVLASFLLLLALPVLAVAALAIRLEDRGPVLFIHERLGRDGNPFRLLKLRSMSVADGADTGSAPTNGRSGPLYKVTNDPRVTKVGRVLRITSIDELPQLINVIRGEMSLVGPRPALATEAADFDEEMQIRHSVPPGLTGLWQVEARDNPSFAAYRRFDLFYVENWRVSLDLVIILLTVQVVISRTVMGLMRANRRRSQAGVADDVIILD